jgi:pyruvate dehydrogenase phosphatase
MNICMPFSENYQEAVTKHNKTPPYLHSRPEVKHIDLVSIRAQRPVLLLYSDGVDLIVNGDSRFPQERGYLGPAPVVMGGLVGDRVDLEFMRSVFEHEVELNWDGSGGNRAVELLGNILGGTDAQRLEQVVDSRLLVDQIGTTGPGLYVDDTAIIVCPLS